MSITIQKYLISIWKISRNYEKQLPLTDGIFFVKLTSYQQLVRSIASKHCGCVPWRWGRRSSSSVSWCDWTTVASVLPRSAAWSVSCWSTRVCWGGREASAHPTASTPTDAPLQCDTRSNLCAKHSNYTTKLLGFTVGKCNANLAG